MNLEEYNRRAVRPQAERLAAQIVEENEEFLSQLNQWGYKPPTRRERAKFWLRDKQQRIKDIWTILSGGDVHEGEY